MVTSERKVGHRGCWLLFTPPRLQSQGLSPQLLILKAPRVATGTSRSTQDNLSLLCLSSDSCSMTPFPLAASSSPEITLGPSHGSWFFLEFLPLPKWHARSEPGSGKEERSQPFLKAQVLLRERGSLFISSMPPLCPLGPPVEQGSGTYIQHHVCSEQ